MRAPCPDHLTPTRPGPLRRAQQMYYTAPSQEAAECELTKSSFIVKRSFRWDSFRRCCSFAGRIQNLNFKIAHQ